LDWKDGIATQAGEIMQRSKKDYLMVLSRITILAFMN
jgi:hypothetical protein